ncbi:uncharacterized protein EKO05_0009149 [Ascochyta rabiei]|uniref:Uncharacterized protein n=1 Tax=Didymella rabiei TaxID=5454 RepID=A0A163IWN9_DIDRA|nr:uncharacterized protein EKO05_0009149 [Ascochyta rabiei]KZM25991.1 hypothetical protein ST47_g2939 [Ascochyta rabiei]UPX18865.1 hypothetical protein EKO05_0009149 [Ascochyta rabiei]
MVATLTPGSLEDVEAWASQEFPDYFRAFVDTERLHTKTLPFDGEYMDGKIILKSMLLVALEVGSTDTGNKVYARISGSNDVELFSDHMIADPTGSKKGLSYMKPAVDLVDMYLRTPYNHSIETGHPAGVDRLETLIRFIFLSNGESTAVQPKLGFFKSHFRAACRDVARGRGVLVDGDDTDESDTLSDTSPPELIADTDTAGLRDNPAATSVFNQHVNAMDESYYDFKTRMLSQLGAIQKTERNQTDYLKAQVQELQCRLTVLEEGRAKMGKELEDEKEKAKTAAEQTASWKTRYEGLKGTLERVLGQRF